jgi:hypothetical protein
MIRSPEFLWAPDSYLEDDMSRDTIKWTPVARIDKYSPEVVDELTRILGYEPMAADFARFGAEPFAVTEVEGNILVAGGLGMLTNALIGGTYDPLTPTSTGRAFVGVGDSSTAAATSQTDLSAATNKYYNTFDSAGITRVTTTTTNDAVQGVSTFGTAVANFAWAEWAWFTTTTGTITPGTTSNVSSGTETMWNRKVASMGTKASGASWVFTTKVTFA